jgi:hypothetical protein
MQKCCSQILNSNHTFIAHENCRYLEVRNEKRTEEMVVLEHPKEKVHSSTRWTTEGVDLLVLLNEQSKDKHIIREIASVLVEGWTPRVIRQ